jgi:type III pantothenate kinase
MTTVATQLPACTLLIDVGNTRIKWATVSAGEILKIDSCLTHDALTAFADSMQALVSTAALIGAVGVCVASDAVRVAITAALKQTSGVSVEWLTGATALPGLRNDYATPHTLGPDRWLAAYGLLEAWPAQQRVAVLATFGTATTVDVVFWDDAASTHVFAGGIIVAGVNTAWRSVSQATARLPDLTALAPDSAALTQAPRRSVPNSTEQALFQGVLYSQAGAVQQMLALAKARYVLDGDAPVACALHVSGGAHDMIKNHLPPAAVCEYPVLEGLVRWWRIKADSAAYPSASASALT